MRNTRRDPGPLQDLRTFGADGGRVLPVTYTGQLSDSLVETLRPKVVVDRSFSDRRTGTGRVLILGPSAPSSVHPPPPSSGFLGPLTQPLREVKSPLTLTSVPFPGNSLSVPGRPGRGSGGVVPRGGGVSGQRTRPGMGE